MIHGTFTPGFEPVANELASLLRAERVGGAAVCVYHRGQCVADIWGGTRDSEGNPWKSETAALSFSTTKGIVATLAHRLADRALLDYDQPVARYWPEFADAGKETITVREVLSHQAGLHSIRSLLNNADQMLDWRAMTDALAAARSFRDPAGRTGYHAITYGWIIGEVIRRVTGKSVNEALQSELAGPLGLDGAEIGAGSMPRERIATLLAPPTGLSPATRVVNLAVRGIWGLMGLDPMHARDALLPDGLTELLYSPRILDAEIPSLNGVFTARSLARVYAMLAGGGVLDGKRFLSESSIARAVEIQSAKRDLIIGLPMRWRLGFHFVGTTRGLLPDAFGHFGYGGSGAWADPARQLAVAMTLNRVARSPLSDRRLLRISSTSVRCADIRKERP